MRSFLGFCRGASPFDFESSCIRGTWGAILPLFLVLVFIISYIPLSQPGGRLKNFLTAPFTHFITIAEAESYLFEDSSSEDTIRVNEDEEAAVARRVNRASVKVTLVLSWLGVLETVSWMGIGSFKLSEVDAGSGIPWDAWMSVFIALSWSYASVKPMLKPQATPPYDLFSFYILQLVLGILRLGGILYDWNVYHLPLPSTLTIVAHVLNLVVVTTLLAVVLSLPISVPSKYVDPNEIGKSVTPEDYTTLWGWITFLWVKPLIQKGTIKPLEERDVWGLSSTIRTRSTFLKFHDIKKGSLLYRIWIANSLDISLDFILTLVSVILEYAGPYFLKRVLDSLEPDAPPASHTQAYLYALFMFMTAILKAEVEVQHLWFVRRASTRCKSELMAAIYHKALLRKDLSGTVKNEKSAKADGKDKGKGGEKHKQSADTGKIVNLMASDTNTVSFVISALYMFYGAPFKIIIASLFLFELLGWSAFAGFVVLFIGWPINSILTRYSIAIQKELLAARDKRMNIVNELVSAVKFIKFFAWEERWMNRAMDARNEELKWQWKSSVSGILYTMFWSSNGVLVSLIAFLVFVIQGNELTVGIAFTAVQLYSMLRTPLNSLPVYILRTMQTKISVDRIDDFLQEEEIDEQVSTIKGTKTSNTPFHEHLGFKNATLKWNTAMPKDEKDKKAKKDKGRASLDSNGREQPTAEGEAGASTPTEYRFELSNISIVFPDGQLTLVTGPTASGKSALLMGLLGELTLQEGDIFMTKDTSRVDANGFQHAISYAAQTPWLQHQTIKDNILFGYSYDEKRYTEVVECCALVPDLQILEDGDQTEIGARGVSLSGGQKARVALARAVYAPTKFILLDDPLSAVDSHTARFLFERLLKGPLMKNRTVVLVTHHVELVLPGAQFLVRMLDGRIDLQGSVGELQDKDLLEVIAADAVVEEDPVKESDTKEQEAIGDTEAKEGERDGKEKKPRKLVEDEERQTGSVKWNIYKTYLKASSYWTWGLLAFSILLTQIIVIAEKYWIKIWGEAYTRDDQLLAVSFLFGTFTRRNADIQNREPLQFIAKTFNVTSPRWTDKLPDPHSSPIFYVGVYATIGAITVFIGVSQAVIQYYGGLKASRRLFKQLLNATVRATMRWYDVTPAGRILNRFSKDIETVDGSLAHSIQSVNTSLAGFFSSAIVVVVIFPLFIVPATLIGYIYYALAYAYLRTGRDLRRMESTSRSPIFSGFSELLDGVVTVRAFSAENRFMNSLYKKIDLTQQMQYAFWMTNRYLLLHFDCLGATAVFITTLFSLSGYVSAGTAGFCITSAMTFTTNIYWACRYYTQLELDLNSVERVVEYLDLPQEPPSILESSRPPAAWPSNSSEELVVVEKLEVKYAPDLPSVLHGVSFTLKPRERVGLLGRTGSGKSTLAMSLLRFVDPTSGKILIDGIDITEIGVQDLRSRITFIPQDATLFSGSLRDNLDPFGDCSDSECLDALHRVHLLSDSAAASQKPSRAPSVHEAEGSNPVPSTSSVTVANEDQKVSITLDTEVSAGGANFSQGQRQLIAMARALLRQSSIIILDEATSSIDFATDAKIQTAIREEFNNSLLLTVAHRLRTVIDYDRLIILDKGQIAEVDTPYNLIQKEGGIFRSMCLKSGTFAELEAAAKIKAI